MPDMDPLDAAIERVRADRRRSAEQSKPPSATDEQSVDRELTELISSFVARMAQVPTVAIIDKRWSKIKARRRLYYVEHYSDEGTRLGRGWFVRTPSRPTVKMPVVEMPTVEMSTVEIPADDQAGRREQSLGLAVSTAGRLFDAEPPGDLDLLSHAEIAVDRDALLLHTHGVVPDASTTAAELTAFRDEVPTKLELLAAAIIDPVTRTPMTKKRERAADTSFYEWREQQIFGPNYRRGR